MSKAKLSAEAKAWILYDGGNSAFATTVIAAFFPIFFNDFWASGLEAEVKTAYLGWGLTISNLVLLLPPCDKSQASASMNVPISLRQSAAV